MKTKKFLIRVVLFMVSVFVLFGIVGSKSDVLTVNAATSTSDLSFLLNSETQEYKVRIANRSATEIIIPMTYEGLPVTAIDDSGFMGCTSLERILIPSSIKTIGNNAFMRCTKLKKVLGMSSVESYGNNAFALCTELEYMIFPSKIKKIGSTILRNVKGKVYSRTPAEEMEEINLKWAEYYEGTVIYGDELVYNSYTNEQGETGFSLAPFQNLSALTENTTVSMDCIYQGQKVLNISQYAFLGCNAKNIIITYPKDYTERFEVNFESGVFMQCLAENIIIDVNITTKDPASAESDNSSTAIFYNCSAKSIELPDTLDKIPYQTFIDCYNLEKIKFGTNEDNHLSPKIKRIESQGFYGCIGLPSLYIPETIEFIGQAAFHSWDLPQSVEIDLPKAGDNWNPNWKEGVKNADVIYFQTEKELDITFVVNQEGVIDASGGITITVNRDSTLNNSSLPQPTSVSHNFNGKWYLDEKRTQEYKLDTIIKSNLTLYAGWEIKEYTITLNENKYLTFYDTTGAEVNEITLKHGQQMQFYVTIKDGYKNVEIKLDNERLIANTGGIYTIVAIKNAEVSCVAALEEYTITYTNLREGTNPNTITTYTVESETINFADPIWDAYNSGTWNITSIPQGSMGNRIITAIWTDPKVYTITYANLRDGTNPNTVTSYTIESNTINFAAPEWNAYDDATWNITSIPKGSWGNKTITAIWTNPVVFSISYTNLRGGTNPNTITSYTVESNTITFAAPEWEAYNGRIWDIPSIPQGSTGNKIISAIWTNPKEYFITYTNLRGGTNPNTVTSYTVESNTINFKAPEWGAYNGRTWDITSIPQGSTGDRTITAIWTNPIVFTITYTNLRSGSNPNTITTYTVESNTITFVAPTWEAYKNSTWDTTSIPKGSWGNKTIEAVWSNPREYSIIYENLSGGTNPNIVTTYTIESNTINFKAPIWEAYTNGSWDTTSIPKGSWGNKKITAIWSNPKVFTITYTNLRGGINPNTITTYTVESNTINFEAPKWDAYKDSTWNITSIPKGSWGNKTITAIWSDPEEYTITFALDDDPNAINPNGQTMKYTVEDRVILRKATSPGYKDSAWVFEGTDIQISDWTPDTYFENMKLEVKWGIQREYNITFDYSGGHGAKSEYTIKYGSRLESFAIPLKYDYRFISFYSDTTGEKYYNSLMYGEKWYQPNDDTLIAEWEQEYFYITFEQQNGVGTGSIFAEPMRVKYGSSWQSIEMPTRKGYEISGFYYKWKMDNRKIYNADGTYNRNNVEFGSTYDIRLNITLFCYWEVKDYYYFNIDIINVRSLNATSLDKPVLAIDQSYYNASAPETLEWVEYGSNGQIISRDERGFSGWRIKINSSSSNWIDYSTNRTLNFNVEEFIDNIILKNFPNYDSDDTIYIRAIYGESLNGGDSGCVAEGTYITLADGSKKLVEELTGNEMLLVWNLYTGKLDIAPILFIDQDAPKMYEVIQLHFSDGTSVKVISEHGFWDLTLNQYVYLDNTASKYIGHWFNKQAMNEDGNFIQTEVQLIDVVVEQEYSSAWSPVTYGNLCYYVNDMLSMPGGIKGLFNIFEVDSEFMKYDEAAMLSDIETYGLFTYEEFSKLVSVPEEIFDAVCGQYLKVAIGKGMITIEEIQQLVNRYSNFF